MVSLAKPYLGVKPYFGFWPYQWLNENMSLEKDIIRQWGMLNTTLGWEPGNLGSGSSFVSNRP